MAKAAHGYAEIKLGRSDVGVLELEEAVNWFKNSRSPFTYFNYALWLAEGYLQGGDRARAKPLIKDVLNAGSAAGCPHFEGRACWLMGECLLAEAPSDAEDYAKTAIAIFERVGSRNDRAKAHVTLAALRQHDGDIAAARRLLGEARATFQTLGTQGELSRIERALAHLDSGLPIRSLQVSNAESR